MNIRLLLNITTVILFTFTVVANAAVEYQFELKGVDGDALTNIKNRLQLLHPASNKKISESTAYNLYRQGPEDIEQALEPFGYYQVRIRSKLIKTKSTWTANYRIKLGRRVHIRHVSIQLIGPGRNDIRLRRYIRRCPLKQGQPFLSNEYDTTKQKLYEIAQKRGYLKAKLTTHRVSLNRKTRTADIKLVFQTGPRYRFGIITINSGPYRESFVKRFIRFRTGQFFSPQKLIALQRNLSDSELFDQVSATPDYENARNQQVPIQIDVKARKARQYLFGLGYGTDTRLRGTLGFNWWRVTDTGHHIKALVQASKIRNIGSIAYIIPGRNPVTDQYSLQLSKQSARIKPGDYDVESLTGSYSHLPRKKLQRTISLSLQKERSKEKGKHTIRTVYLIPSIIHSYTHTDHKVNPNNGYRINTTLSSGLSLQFNNAHFFKTEIGVKVIKSLRPFGRFILRGNLGMIAVNNINQLPLSLQYKTGGPQTVRGYQYESIGGGRYLKIISAEYQQPIYKQWYAAIFSDAGNASNSLKNRFLRSAGVGIGYRSIIGPLQLTVAQPFDKIRGKRQSLNVQFAIGPDL